MKQESLTPHDTFLISHAQTALTRGRQLFEWWKTRESDGTLDKFELLPPQGPLLEMLGFYDDLEPQGQRTSVMGCLQRARFRPVAPSVSLEQRVFSTFLRGQFLKLCRWTHPGGQPGGIGYRPLQYKVKESGELGVFSRYEAEPTLDLADVGQRYDWVVLRVDIHDFVRSFPPLQKHASRLSKHVKEAAYVVVHEEYAPPVSPTDEDSVAEWSFGYSFLPCLAEPNFFGFGPGRFWAAIKQFRFLLLNRGELEIQVSFVVAPRSQKVLYFWGFDPVYSMVHLANALTFGLFHIKERAHDKFDRIMLKLHGQVHHNLLLGMRSLWEQTRWLPASSNR